DAAAVDAGFGGVPFLVGPSDFKASQFLPEGGHAVGRVFEANLDGLVLHGHGLVGWAQRAEAFATVSLGQGQQGEAGAARLLA
nr:hypothetical protein [Tanacetum cinerariifolium]